MPLAGLMVELVESHQYLQKARCFVSQMFAYFFSISSLPDYYTFYYIAHNTSTVHYKKRVGHDVGRNKKTPAMGDLIRAHEVN